jgi:hypothetical protein
MPLLISCPGCDKKLKVAETVLGKKVRCPGCSATFLAKENDDSPALVEPVAPRQAPRREDADEDRLSSAPATPRVARRPRLAPDDEDRFRRVRRPKSHLGLILSLVIGGLLLLGVVVGAVVFLAMRVGSITEGDWKEFAPPGGRFSILMPGTPVQSSVPGGTKYLIQRWDKNMSFAVVSFDLGAGFLPPDVMQAMSNAERDNLKTFMDATVVSEKDVNLGGLSCHEVQMRASGDVVAIMRFYMVKQENNSRVYQLLAAGPRFQADSGLAAKFFDSFKPETTPAAPNPGPGVNKLPPGGGRPKGKQPPGR